MPSFLTDLGGDEFSSTSPHPNNTGDCQKLNTSDNDSNNKTNNNNNSKGNNNETHTLQNIITTDSTSQGQMYQMDSDGSSSPTTRNSTTGNNWNLIKNPSNGRTRISQACDRCRARKIKCSGKSENSPKCTNCEKDGFPCVVSDKLTRNSFPKGYTKNLEKKLLDVELSRNQLLLEISKLKQKLASVDPSLLENDNNVNSKSRRSSSQSKEVKKEDDSEFGITLEKDSSSSNDAVDVDVDMDMDEDKVSNDIPDSKTPQELNDINIKISREQVYFRKPLKTNPSGLLTLDQNLKSPFETIFASLKSNPFKGYKTSSFNTNQASLNSENKSSSDSNNSFAQSVSLPLENLSPSAFKYLTNYHMNLNRYLNLILYKLIFPLFNSDSKSSLSSSSSNKNLDHLIWIFFNDYNKLIPILDFELFYNDYLTFVNTYTIKNSTYTDNGETKKRYYEFSPKDQDTLIKLILILKYTLCQPKIDSSNTSSAFLPDKFAINQFDESVKLINVKHLIMMFRNINFTLSPNLDKLEISLLMLYYLIKYENYNLPNYTDSLHSHKDFLLDVINLNKSLVHILHIDKNNSLIVSNIDTNKKLIELQRLKLYWNHKILIKLCEIYFNIPLIEKEYDLNNDYNDENSKLLPDSLNSIILVNNDIKITICLVKLLKLIPWNIMDYVNNNNVKVLKKVDAELSVWKKSVEDLYNDENCVVFNKLKSYYLYFKVLVNINGTIDSSYFIDFINLVYDLTFNNPKSNYKNHEISIEAAESLCLHSFNFHLLTLISITSLQKNKDKKLCDKNYKLIQLYQILIYYKDVDPLITTFVNYIKDNILFAFSDASTIHDDTLKMFSSVEMDKAHNTSLFDKKVMQRSSSSTKSQMNFDLNAFNLPCDSMFEENSSSKRRKSNASTNSFISSNVSVASRDSSIVSSSRRLSASSNDSTPSLFPSATSPYPNSSNSHLPPTSNSDGHSSAKKRIMDYTIQPIRTMNRSRSLSSDSRIRNSKPYERRLSGSNNFSNNHGIMPSRESSVDSILHKSSTLGDGVNIEDDLISHIFNSDVDSEVDSETGNNSAFRKMSNFKHNSSLLPTIPSEGNLMKIMGVLDSSNPNDTKKMVSVASEFDLESLFSANNIPGNTDDKFPDAPADSNQNMFIFDPSGNDMHDFSKAYKKSPAISNALSSAFNSPNNTNIQPQSVSSDKGLIDSDDLNRLKERVLSMKSSAQ